MPHTSSGKETIVKKYMVFALLPMVAICLFMEYSGGDLGKTDSSYNYPSGYSVKSLDAQIGILLQAFPGLSEIDLSSYNNKNTLPDGAEGLFLIPDWQKIAPTYGEAVDAVFAKLKQSRDGKFFNWRDGKLGANYLRQSERSIEFWDKLKARQESDILMIPAQVGKWHQGRSVEQARDAFNNNEFGLGAYEVGMMLLTHPERLVNFNDLWIDCPGIDCPGDEYSWSADGQFGHAPYFRFYDDDGGFGFGMRFVDIDYDFYGSASGFLPQ